MASPLFAIALLIHHIPLAPPEGQGFVVPKGKIEHVLSELSLSPDVIPENYSEENLQVFYSEQVSEEVLFSLLTPAYSFPILQAPSPSSLNLSISITPPLLSPPHKELFLVKFSPLEIPSSNIELPELGQISHEFKETPPIGIARSPKAHPLRMAPFSRDLLIQEEISLILPEPTPCCITLIEPLIPLKELSYLHPDTKALIALSKGKVLLEAPSLPPSIYINYEEDISLFSLLVPRDEGEAPFMASEETFHLYETSAPVATKISLSSREAPLPSLFESYLPSPSKDRVASLLNNYSSKEYNLSRQPTSDQLNNVAFDDQFEIDVGVIPRRDQKGYLFHVNLYPKANLTLHQMKQNFVFVIDKSSSIKEFRYDIFRRAVLESLDYLQEGDTFNIYLVDNKVHKLSEEPLLWRKSSVRKASEFLYSQDFNKYYASSADAYDTIEKVHEEMASFDGELTVIFVTDGSTLMDIRKRKFTLANLITSNNHKYTLHTACMSKDSSASMLDLLSTFNRGEFISSQTHAAFPRKFCRLVKHVSQIITKDIHLSTLSNQSVTLFPSPRTMPQMYVDRPFTIYGTATDLEDFDLIIQGKFDDRYLFMKKKIHLKTAPRSTKPLQKQFAIHQAYLCYEHYLDEHDEFYLEEAKKQLSKYKLRSAASTKK
jgi:hypothetical protein